MDNDTDRIRKDSANIPIATIARLFQSTAFKNEKTRITQKTLQLSSEYIKLFINEALIRSNEERLAEGDSLTKVDGIDNLNKPREIEHRDIDARVVDETMNDGSEPEDEEDLDDPTQIGTQNQTAYNLEVDLGNDTLDAKHLSKVAGILVLDF
mmetsp:Transcript_2534/g.2470  ORF Transcript_2534/g.2470 Transcript_2534/m.2470 type:complete len:153 (+) Transcript_2534:88-546(+)